jgi:hypothetical protein
VKQPRGASEQHSGRSAMGCPHTWMGAGPALGAHRHSGTDPRNSQRARRVALACEVVSEDHITRSKTARGAIADPDFHLPQTASGDLRSVVRSQLHSISVFFPKILDLMLWDWWIVFPSSALE